MKKKRFIMVMVLMTIFFTVMAGCGSSNNSGGDEKITLKVASYFPNTSPIYTAVTGPWMERVTELTDGKVEFEYFPAEQLGKAHDLLKLTGSGVTDISIIPANYYGDNMPYSHLLAAFPDLSETSAQGTIAYHELLKESSVVLEEDYLKNGVRPILTHVSPTYELWTTGKEIHLPEDLKGVKVKTPGGIANEMYESLGAVPVAIAHAETYEALEKGIIDVASYYAMAIKSSGTEDLLRYAIFPHLGSVIHGLNIKEDVWQGLSDDVKDAMLQAGQEIMESSGNIYNEETEKFNAEFVKNGGVIKELTEVEQEKWNKATAEFANSWLKEHEADGYQYKEVLETYRKLLEAHKE
ncbi:MAG: TRAP transporter substrate-binding protein DctP [Bacillus sp. (in: firmicutes)]